MKRALTWADFIQIPMMQFQSSEVSAEICLTHGLLHLLVELCAGLFTVGGFLQAAEADAKLGRSADVVHLQLGQCLCHRLLRVIAVMLGGRFPFGCCTDSFASFGWLQQCGLKSMQPMQCIGTCLHHYLSEPPGGPQLSIMNSYRHQSFLPHALTVLTTWEVGRRTA